MKTLVIYSIESKNPNLAFFQDQGLTRDFTLYYCPLGQESSFVSKFETKEFDRFIFLSSKLCGPFLPLWYRGRKTWANIFSDMIKGNVILAASEMSQGKLYGAFVTNQRGIEIV